MPECRKSHFSKISFESFLHFCISAEFDARMQEKSFFQNFLGEHAPTLPRERDLMAPEVLQPPTLKGSATYFRTH